MSRPDLEYYRRRLAAERRQAETAQGIEVRRVHRELADRYGALLGETPVVETVS